MTEQFTWQEIYRRRLEHRASLYAGFGISGAMIGLVLCVLAGLQIDFNRISVPAAQVGIVLLIIGFALVGRAIYLDWLSRRA